MCLLGIMKSPVWQSKSGNAKAGKLAGIWITGFGLSGNCFRKETEEATLRTLPHHMGLTRLSGFRILSPGSPIPRNPMSARMMVSSSGPRSAGVLNSASSLLGPVSIRAELLFPQPAIAARDYEPLSVVA